MTDENQNGIEEIPKEFEKSNDEDENNVEDDFDSSLKHVMVFTMAGKPVWSRYGNEETNSVFVGILFTIFSILDESGDQIGEIELELSIVKDQILSLMSGGEIKKRYDTNSSFDLRRYISGSEKFLHSICDSIESDPAFVLQGLNLFPFPASKRDALGNILASCRDEGKDPALVFSMICFDEKVLCMCQDKYIPQFDPIDVLLLLNLIKNQQSLKDSEVWLPVCLPNLEAGHSLQSHISYIDESSRVCLIMVSRDRNPANFFALQKVRETIINKMTKKKIFDELLKPNQSYLVQDVGIPDLTHFLYFCNGNKQMTSPAGGEQCIERYRSLNSILSDEKVKLLYRVNDRSVTVAWKTKNFNLFVSFAPLVSRKNAIQSITYVTHTSNI